ITNSHEYFSRMEAINFTQAHDDGVATRDLGKAQVILVGVSRCGKTPTSLYLALQFGIRAANFPLTPDDFADRRLPASVLPFRDRLFGLTINPERLHQIREERRPGSNYAALDTCRHEIREAEHLMQSGNIAMLDTTAKSIEEIATTILHRAKLQRHIY
ncbi:MAG: kinase/pyrophosphorylase, partial [Casimicrobiaceae bacterium]